MKKVTAILSAILILFSSFSIDVQAAAHPSGIIHSDQTEFNISKNVVYKNIKRFTDLGWQNIHIIEADISKSGTEIDLLYPKQGIGSGSTLSEMLTDDRTVAAINGDFFLSGSSFSPIGPVISDSRLVSSPTYRMDELAVFSIDRDNIPALDYWDWKIHMETENISLPVSAVNKISYDYNYPMVYTPDWGQFAPQAPFEDIVYTVIVNGRIMEHIPNPAAEVAIPKDGMILVTRGQHAQLITTSAMPGEPIELVMESQPDFERIKLAIGAGSILVKDGVIAPFTHNIEGYQPRTALGITRDRKRLIAVTVDGRDKSFAGMTQLQLAGLMLELGAYYAVNLDGGGSSTMLARKPGDEQLSLVNLPSDGSLRRISNGLAINNTDTRKTGLRHIILQVDDHNVFFGTGRTIIVKGYDSNYNPVPIDLRDVQWQATGVEGSFSGNVFYPSATGKAVITARYMGRQADIELQVLDTPALLEIPYKQIKTGTQQSLPFNVYGKNMYGFSALIENRDLNLKSDLGSFTSQYFLSGNTEGAGIIRAEYGSLAGEIPVSVGYRQVMLDDFEMPNGSFLSYPASVQGHYVLDVTNPFGGRKSGRLAYDFTAADATAASYLVFNGDGIRLDTVPERIGLQVCAPRGGSHWLRMMVEDSTGSSITLDLTRKLDWKGYRWVDTEIPANLKAPIYIKRIYLVETNPIMHDTGMILLDNLTALYSYPLPQPATDPGQREADDPARAQIPPAEWDFSFSFFGSTAQNRLLDIHIVRRMKDTLADCNLAIFAGNIDSRTVEDIKVPVITTEPGYAEAIFQNNAFIKLDNHGGGLRAFSPQQWYWLKDKLDNLSTDNLFVILPRPVWEDQGFNDPMEAKLLHRYLSNLYLDKGLQVYVLYGHAKGFEYDILDGVRYIGIGGTTEITGEYSLFDDFKYIRFYISSDGRLNYTVNPLFKR